ncbi:MAG: putative A/G-specific adenine glycosylase YfhQ [Candidatus Dependentiae bacterium ADurb.Bin331]|nr:MAG: putative A/G-specific adenine glycosylase YfhQ [Candidatus Dependentiae bacterium ADurb.Bin331]
MKSKQLDTATIEQFKKTIWHYFHTQGRTFSWRKTTDPYLIVVSEIMLQQTQTFRVEPKFENFTAHFPTFQTLATAPFSEVLRCWKGLGYNRRALALQKIAQEVVHNYNGILPNDPEILDSFPGIGPATAASICAFAFNKPTIFIETNIRAVFIHFFFQNQTKITDAQIYPLVAQTVDEHNPRNWYYALMDYGVLLKKMYPNPSRKSAHHTKQSTFEGSNRQIRGLILQALLEQASCTFEQLCCAINRDKNKIAEMLNELIKDKLIEYHDPFFKLSS